MVRGPAFLVLALAVIAVLGFVVMSLWNWLIQTLFRGPQLDYWQAVGVLVLSRILFGGLRGRGGRHRHWRERMFWQERWANMTPEERERMREHFGRWWGREPRDGGQAPQPPPTL
jgi:hypothetical protein